MRRCCSDWDAHTHGAQGPQQRRAGRQAQGLRRGQRPSAPADTLISGRCLTAFVSRRGFPGCCFAPGLRAAQFPCNLGGAEARLKLGFQLLGQADLSLPPTLAAPCPVYMGASCKAPSHPVWPGSWPAAVCVGIPASPTSTNAPRV